ncbi:hypothetical protein DFH09DRAFT_975531 [Mycena vulgaris]|nr:hypothetical protein DFH09DRAFT_975531 [Mycena vulgaris]
MIYSDRSWIQSLRAESSPTLRASNASDKARLSRSFSLPNVDRRVSAPPVYPDDRDPRRKRQDAAVPHSPTSSRNRRSDTALDLPTKCPNLCCKSLSSGDSFQSGPKTIARLLLDYHYHVDPEEAARIRQEISRAESQDASYEKEIIRLKRLLAACPPPDHKLPVVWPCKTPKLCIHACCDTSTLPPRASTEMLRLRRIVQHLEHRRQSIRRYLHAKRCFLSPIRRLPPELLQTVFSFTVLRDQLDLSFAAAVSPVRLAHVCSYWRAIALDTSKLWFSILLPFGGIPSIDHLKFYAAHSKTRLLTIRCCRWPSPRLLSELVRISHRWRDITLKVGNHTLKELDDVPPQMPMLKSLYIHNTSAGDMDTHNAFHDAPSLRRVVLTTREGEYIWPSSFVLPWYHITSLTLASISLSVFSEGIMSCPQLLYFHAGVIPWPDEVIHPMSQLRSPLRKLVLQGRRCGEILGAHTFPNLLSLTIDCWFPETLAFLSGSSHLEMLAVRSCNLTPTVALVALLPATPSLRIMHFNELLTAMVTPRFYTPLLPPAPDDPFLPLEPQSLPALGIEGCITFDEAALLAVIHARCPSFDPHGIEKARLEVKGVPFDPEAELAYLLSDATH